MELSADDSKTLAVVVQRLDDVITRLDRMETNNQNAVPRGEWMLRNQTVDGLFQSQGREISELKTELRSRRQPWPAVLAAVLAGCALAWSILGPTITGG